MEIYEPAEDSYLLAEAVAKHVFGKVLDMGTGSGIQAATALKNSNVKAVTAVDVNEKCGDVVKKISSEIKFIQSNLFSKVPKQKFDTIIFNPPYLPQDEGIDDPALYGGKKGYEVTEHFLGQCDSYLAKDGIILLLFSNFTNRRKIDEIIESNCLNKELIDEKKLPMMETLFVYKITKSPLMTELERQKIAKIRKFATGNRGVIYTGILGKKKVAIKAVAERSPVKDSIKNEMKWLKLLNRHKIGVKLVSISDNHFVYEFVDGNFILDFIDKSAKKGIITVLKAVLRQCRKLDELGVNKLEMGHPQRHIIIKSSKPVLLDFERCKNTENPKNVTQFCQFLMSGQVQEMLSQKKILIDKSELLNAAKDYKTNFRKIDFEKLIKLI